MFTEFVPTQEMLRRFLTERGFSVVCLNGSMDMEERKRVQEAFAKDARILISTDAGGEGLNLQFCHVVINYDIPWNPMRLEQRIGRVDRIGQTHTVRAVNFVFEDSVEHRVREVLEQKLAVIFEEFGIDKTGDVLDSAQAGQMFDEMYVEAILNPEKVEDSVESVVARLQEQAREARTTASVLGATEDLEPGEAQRLLTHPLPHWVERMTVSYLKAHGGQAERKKPELEPHLARWRNIFANVVFTAKEAEKASGRPAPHSGRAEGPRLWPCGFPRFAPGQPVPSYRFPASPRKSRASGPCGGSPSPLWSGTVGGSCLSSWPTTARSTCQRPDTSGISSSRQIRRSGRILDAEVSQSRLCKAAEGCRGTREAHLRSARAGAPGPHRARAGEG